MFNKIYAKIFSWAKPEGFEQASVQDLLKHTVLWVNLFLCFYFVMSLVSSVLSLGLMAKLSMPCLGGPLINYVR